MGRKTDVGVLSIFATMDTTQFSQALKKTGQQAKAWSVKIRGNLNSISGSFTELNSKLSFISAGMASVGASVTGVAQAMKLAFSGSAADAEALQMTLERLPFGFGEVARWAKEAMIAIGLFRHEVEELSATMEGVQDLTQQAFQQMLDVDQYKLDTETFIEKLFPKEFASKLESEIARFESIDEKLIQEQFKLEELRQQTLTKIAETRKQMTGEGFFRSDYEEMEEQLEALNRLAGVQSKALRANHERQALLWKHAQKAITKIEAEEAKKRAEAEAKRMERIKRIRDRMHAQESRVRKMQTAPMTGATETITTAVGAIKIRDESRTAAMQRAQLEELKKETDILRDIHRELQDAGGALT